MTLTLRQLSTADAERVASLVGDREVSRWTSNIPHPYSVDDAIEWIARTGSSPTQHSFAVELEQQLVACVSYWYLDSGDLEIGYWVGRDYWGTGVATRALGAMLARPDFPAHLTVFARTLRDNQRSQGVLTNCGFTRYAEDTIEREHESLPALLYHRAPGSASQPATGTSGVE